MYIAGLGVFAAAGLGGGCCSWGGVGALAGAGSLAGLAAAFLQESQEAVLLWLLGRGKAMAAL